MAADSVTIKAYLSGSTEIRRLANIPRSWSWEDLELSFTSLFNIEPPSLLRVTYNDEEGDAVRISTLEELRALLASVPPGELLRLYVDVEVPSIHSFEWGQLSPVTPASRVGVYADVAALDPKRVASVSEGGVYADVTAPDRLDHSSLKDKNDAWETSTWERRRGGLREGTGRGRGGRGGAYVPPAFRNGKCAKKAYKDEMKHQKDALKEERKLMGKLKARFVEHVSVPDGSMYSPNTSFLKVWRFRNEGWGSWPPACSLLFISKKNGDRMGAPESVCIARSVPPAGLVDVAVNMVAPALPGMYRGFWRLCDPTGRKFGQRVWVNIHVASPTSLAETPPSQGAAMDGGHAHVTAISSGEMVVRISSSKVDTEGLRRDGSDTIPAITPVAYHMPPGTGEGAFSSSSTLGKDAPISQQLKYLHERGFVDHALNVQLLSQLDGDVCLAEMELRRQLEHPEHFDAELRTDGDYQPPSSVASRVGNDSDGGEEIAAHV